MKWIVVISAFTVAMMGCKTTNSNSSVVNEDVTAEGIKVRYIFLDDMVMEKAENWQKSGPGRWPYVVRFDHEPVSTTRAMSKVLRTTAETMRQEQDVQAAVEAMRPLMDQFYLETDGKYRTINPRETDWKPFIDVVLAEMVVQRQLNTRDHAAYAKALLEVAQGFEELGDALQAEVLAHFGTEKFASLDELVMSRAKDWGNTAPGRRNFVAKFDTYPIRTSNALAVLLKDTAATLDHTSSTKVVLSALQMSLDRYYQTEESEYRRINPLFADWKPFIRAVMTEVEYRTDLSAAEPAKAKQVLLEVSKGFQRIGEEWMRAAQTAGQ